MYRSFIDYTYDVMKKKVKKMEIKNKGNNKTGFQIEKLKKKTGHKLMKSNK